MTTLYSRELCYRDHLMLPIHSPKTYNKLPTCDRAPTKNVPRYQATKVHIQRIKCQICSKLFPGRVFPARKQRALVSSDLKCKFRADLPSLDLPEVLEAQFCADSHRRRLATSIKLGPKSKLGAETSCWTRPHKYYMTGLHSIDLLMF